MTLKVGIAGGKRGKKFYDEFIKSNQIEVTSIMDPDEDILKKFQETAKVKHVVKDYDELLNTGIDIVVIASPMQFHAEQAIKALDQDIHVLSEVTAAVTLEESRKLLEAAKRSKAKYMLAENYCFIPENICITNMV